MRMTIISVIATLVGIALPIETQAQTEEMEFQSSINHLLDRKTSQAESQRLVAPYRRAAHIVETALDDHWRAQTPRAPLTLIEAARMLRAVECSRRLADYVDATTPGGFGGGPLAMYPAAQTLVEFGSLGYPGIFERLGHEASDAQLQLFALIFIQVDGKHLAIVRLEQVLEDHVRGKAYQGEGHMRTRNLRRLAEILKGDGIGR